MTEWEVFRTFCEKQAIGIPEALACHLAYINHMVHGETWDVPADLALAASLLADIGGPALPALRMLIRSGHPECGMLLPVMARLHGVSTQHRLEILAQAASHANPDVRYSLLQALRAFTRHEAEPLLRTLSRDQDTEIADDARSRLASLKVE